MTTPTCPRCLGPIPNRLDPGAYPGALSRVDDFTEVCSDCGLEEAVEQWNGTLRQRSEWPARAGAL